MSELKAIHAYTFDEVEVISTHSNGNDYYLKSEVDNVIAEKDREIVELKGQVDGFKNRSSLWHFNAVEEHKKACSSHHGDRGKRRENKEA